MRVLCKNNVNGYLCREKDTQQIAQKLIQIISDPKLRAAFSQESIKIASKFDIKYSVARFEKIYKKAIKLSKAKYAKKPSES
jgi:glycosyltransferase involved in cell wall biosynthesis